MSAASSRDRGGTLALSWGKWGGFYWTHGWAVWRLCLGWVALTYVPLEVERLMEAYADQEQIVVW